jgi:hypothetical protein
MDQMWQVVVFPDLTDGREQSINELTSRILLQIVEDPGSHVWTGTSAGGSPAWREEICSWAATKEEAIVELQGEPSLSNDGWSSNNPTAAA